MYKCGDIIMSPWGKGLVLSEEADVNSGFYILWVGFNAHGFGKAEFRLENAHSDEPYLMYCNKIGNTCGIPGILQLVNSL